MTELSDGFATQSLTLPKRKADMPDVPSTSLRSFRRIFGRMRMRQRSRSSNERVRSGVIEGQQKKRICPKIHSTLNSEVRRVKCNSEANSRKKRIVDCWLLNKLYY